MGGRDDGVGGVLLPSRGGGGCSEGVDAPYYPSSAAEGPALPSGLCWRMRDVFCSPDPTLQLDRVSHLRGFRAANQTVSMKNESKPVPQPPLVLAEITVERGDLA